jgi:hypothetical protein
MDTYLGKYTEVYDGPTTVDIVFAIKSNLSMVSATMPTYIGNRCRIKLGNKYFVGEPWLGKYTKRKYALSITFDKDQNLDNQDAAPGSVMLDNLMAMADQDNLEMQIEWAGESTITKVDPQFWQKIKKTLMDIAAYGGVSSEWERYRQEVKREFGLPYIVGPYMTAEDAESFYAAIREYAEKYDVPIREEKAIIRDISTYIEKCRANQKCVVCGKPAYNDAVYPVCQDHYDQYMELGKDGFDLKYHF